MHPYFALWLAVTLSQITWALARLTRYPSAARRFPDVRAAVGAGSDPLRPAGPALNTVGAVRDLMGSGATGAACAARHKAAGCDGPAERRPTLSQEDQS